MAQRPARAALIACIRIVMAVLALYFLILRRRRRRAERETREKWSEAHARPRAYQEEHATPGGPPGPVGKHGQEGFQLGRWVARRKAEARLLESLSGALVRLAEPLAEGETGQDRETAVTTGSATVPGVWFDPEAGEWTAWEALPGDAEPVTVRASSLRRNFDLENKLKGMPDWGLPRPGDP